MQKIIERIKEYEGYRDQPYQCTAGKWTIGYGYNYQDRGFTTEDITAVLSRGFTKELAERLIEKDAKRCAKEAEENFPFFNSLNEARQAVIVDMLYQLGFKGLSGFKNFLARLSEHNYEAASAEMIHSRWFTQSGRRSRTNVKQMKTGQWEEVA
ncbi:MAG: glycoside hydrolase family protein [Deferribacterales bacterium]